MSRITQGSDGQAASVSRSGTTERTAQGAYECSASHLVVGSPSVARMFQTGPCPVPEGQSKLAAVPAKLYLAGLHQHRHRERGHYEGLHTSARAGVTQVPEE